MALTYFKSYLFTGSVAYGAPVPFAQLAERTKVTFGAVAKGGRGVIGYPIGRFARCNCKLHATQIMFCNIAGRPKLNLKS
jgi:hypothetical protein